MSSNSPFFNLILATVSDTVNVKTHIADNFSTVDSILSQAHTGTGQLKAGLVIQTPTLVNPTISGTIGGLVGTSTTSGGSLSLVIADTGQFHTITATGGVFTASTFAIGTYNYPSFVGNPGDVIQVITGNAVFAAPAPGTGANTGLANLSSVAINTNLNAFTASVVTVTTLKANVITATGGVISGLSSLSATSGSFGSDVSVVGTLNAGVINATGGTITAGNLSVGTYSLPNTIGGSGQVLSYITVTSAGWAAPISNYNQPVFQVGQLNADCSFRNDGGTSSAYGWAFSSTTNRLDITTITSAIKAGCFYSISDTATYRQVGSTVFYKLSAQNTLECYSRAWSNSATNTGARVKIAVGAATATSSFLGITSPASTFTVINVDISALTINTYHSVVYSIFNSGNATQVSYTDGIVGFVKT